MRFDLVHDKCFKAKATPKWMNNRNWEHVYILLNKADCSTVFEARIYCTASGAQVGCRAWLRMPDDWGYGVGKASGYGYDRISSAVYHACKDMGIIPEGDEGECGKLYPDSGIDGVMVALKDGIEKAFGIELVNKAYWGD